MRSHIGFIHFILSHAYPSTSKQYHGHYGTSWESSRNGVLTLGYAAIDLGPRFLWGWIKFGCIRPEEGGGGKMHFYVSCCMIIGVMLRRNVNILLCSWLARDNSAFMVAEYLCGCFRVKLRRRRWGLWDKVLLTCRKTRWAIFIHVPAPATAGDKFHRNEIDKKRCRICAPSLNSISHVFFL